MRRTLVVVPVIGAAILVGGAALAATRSADTPARPTAVASPVAFDADAARRAAVAAVPGSPATEVESLAGGGWKVHVVGADGVRSEVWLDANGAVVKVERNGDDDRSPGADDPTTGATPTPTRATPTPSGTDDGRQGADDRGRGTDDPPGDDHGGGRHGADD
jgi:hypothetical protein